MNSKSASAARRLLLRSATPDLGRAGIVYGLLLAHFGVRHEMLGAGSRAGRLTPPTFSFDKRPWR